MDQFNRHPHCPMHPSPAFFERQHLLAKAGDGDLSTNDYTDAGMIFKEDQPQNKHFSCFLGATLSGNHAHISGS